MLRLMGFLVAAVMSVGGFLAVDYTMAKRWASAQDSEGLTVQEYLGGFLGRMTGSGTADAGLPRTLAEMMPQPPKGWTVRPTVPEDAEAFLPKDRAEGSPEVRKYVAAVGKPSSGSGTDEVSLTYERGDRRVIFQAVRFPDAIFTSFAAMSIRMELQMQQPVFRPTEFMTVRGLDVVEDLLPDGIRVRYFSANVGAQIQIRVLASKRMSDADMVPFFETLHVKAMNASVIDKRDGLGEVPVIVLASVLDKATREAYEADLATRAAEAEAKQATAEAEVEAAAAAADPDGDGRLKLDSEDKASGTGVTCETRAGTKFCTVNSDE